MHSALVKKREPRKSDDGLLQVPQSLGQRIAGYPQEIHKLWRASERNRSELLGGSKTIHQMLELPAVVEFQQVLPLVGI